MLSIKSDKVTAADGAQNEASQAASRISDLSPPTADGTLSATSVSETGVTLSWNAANDIVSPQSAMTYEVRRSTDPNNSTVSRATKPVTRLFTISCLSQQQTRHRPWLRHSSSR